MADSVADASAPLASAELEVIGRFANASNATLLVRLRQEGGGWPSLPLDDDGDLVMPDLAPAGFAVYKPQQGEAPLWDFPQGTLHRREVAAYEVDRLLGWDLVPTTVLREDAPYGVGSVQRFVPHDPERHYFALLEEDRAGVVAQLRQMVLFDLVIDNADRKGGHVLLEGHRVRLVDHGVSFNVFPKLRTVGWDFVGEPVPDTDRRDVTSLLERLERNGADTARLRNLLADDEYERLVRRAADVAALEHYPAPTSSRPFPWPLV